MNFWLHLSNLGDVVTMGFTAAMIAAGLLFGRAWRAACFWCLLIGMGMVLVVASKIAFLAWGCGICALNFTGFSGHATRAMAIAPVFLYLLLNRAPRALQRVGVLLGVAFGFAIGVSRLVLHVHSLSEVVSGWMLGGGIAFLFIYSGRSLQGVTEKICRSDRRAGTVCATWARSWRDPEGIGRLLAFSVRARGGFLPAGLHIIPHTVEKLPY